MVKFFIIIDKYKSETLLYCQKTDDSREPSPKNEAVSVFGYIGVPKSDGAKRSEAVSVLGQILHL